MMRKSVVSYRKNRAGNVLKCLREVYLREDIPCGLKSCKSCQSISGLCLSTLDLSTSDTLNIKKILIFDEEVCFTQYGVFGDARIRNVVILQSVLLRVREENFKIFMCLRNLLIDDSKNFFCFFNNFCSDTFTETSLHESSAAYDQRRTEKTVMWYYDHIQRFNRDVTLEVICLREERRNFFSQKGLSARTFVEYIDSFQDASLYESIDLSFIDSGTKDLVTFSKPTVSFSPHYTAEEIESKLASGLVFSGTYQSTRGSWTEGSVICSTDSTFKSLLVSGTQNINRALPEDIVAFEMLPEEEWGIPSRSLEAERHDPENEDRRVTGVPIPSARIVGIIKRVPKVLCGTLLQGFGSGRKTHLFRPLNRAYPFISIDLSNDISLEGKRICVSIDSWPRRSRYPLGHYLNSIGALGDKNVETEAILMEYSIRCDDFSPAVLKCLPQLAIKEQWEPESLLQKQPFRRDFRHLDVCSIDPPGCTDIDDALHCRLLGTNVYEVGVHIADVTQFVIPGTALDDEAFLRGTTVYLSDRRVDMIPGLLSSNLCSLMEGQDRLAFSVLWYFDENGNLLEDRPIEFCKSVIRSRKAFSYDAAQSVLDDTENQSNIANSLRQLLKISKVIRERRTTKGALVLSSSEIRFEMDAENIEPTEICSKMVLETNLMIEDYMILANTTVAAKLVSHYPDKTILRCHPRPEPSSFLPICDLLSEKLNIDSNLIEECRDDLGKLIDFTRSLHDPALTTLIKILSTRCLSQALYFSSGTKDPKEYYHYGLAEEVYTHFTSPIRRYADVLVHRLLASAVGIESTNPLSSLRLQEACDHINVRNRSARYAAWSSLKLFTCLFVKKCPGGRTVEDGYVLVLMEDCMKVYIPRFGREGDIYFNKTNCFENTAVLSENKSSVTINAMYTLKKLQKVKVLMAVKDLEPCHVDSLLYSLIEPKIPGLSVEV